LLQLFCNEKCQLERLHVIESRIAERFVTRRKRRLIDILASTEALRDIVAGELNVHAPRKRADFAVRLKKAEQFIHDIVKSTSLVAVRCRDAVSVHGVSDPERGCPRIAHTSQQ